MRTILALLLVGSACGDNHVAGDANGSHDSATDGTTIDGNPLTPDTLAGTGLCLDAGCQQISTDARAYTPRFALWSDGASKRRWIYLPPGTQIDTSDMNYWKFPIGTKLWKEFTRDGTRVETRYIVKLADEGITSGTSWYYVSYAWNAAQDATTAVTQGAMNVNGTQHDIPSRTDCRACHERLAGPDHQRGRILGFGAIQLDTAGPSGGYDLATLVAENKLTVNPTGAAPYFPLTNLTAHEQTAYGYFHANCGHCHNPTSQVHDTVGLEFRLLTTALASGTTVPAYLTTVNVTEALGYPSLPLGSKIVVPHDTANSVLYQRMNDTNFIVYHMPALGTEMTDPTGTATIATWIGDLP